MTNLELIRRAETQLTAKVSRDEYGMVGQCLNYSVGANSWLIETIRPHLSDTEIVSRIVIGNFAIGKIGADEQLYPYVDDEEAAAFARNPQAYTTRRAQYHAWNLINGVIVDLTLSSTLRRTGAPIPRARPIFTDTEITSELGFNIRWIPYEIYTVEELRAFL
ncbi:MULTISPECIES: hypothetical protein [Brucella]|uniref:hypothetical protein n=1 Tax=Brucella TaxID=234 RepID=UPI00124C9FA3|nr:MULTISPECIES: hypothetical protein [Brucella]KAB2747910.1 hypothetical protein F9L05_14835 [Brucella anthropi]